VGDRIQGADPEQGKAERHSQPTGAGDADAQAREGSRAEPDRDRIHLVPASGGRRGGLDLLQQPRRVPGAAIRLKPQEGLVEDLGAALGADGGVLRRGVEADERQASPGP
jgi:hypothetical protein